MEKTLKIKLTSQYYLYGKYKGSTDKPLIIIVHGLAGDMEEDLYRNVVDWFYSKGYSTFRFNLYSY